MPHNFNLKERKGVHSALLFPTTTSNIVHLNAARLNVSSIKNCTDNPPTVVQKPENANILFFKYVYVFFKVDAWSQGRPRRKVNHTELRFRDCFLN